MQGWCGSGLSGEDVAVNQIGASGQGALKLNEYTLDLLGPKAELLDSAQMTGWGMFPPLWGQEFGGVRSKTVS